MGSRILAGVFTAGLSPSASISLFTSFHKGLCCVPRRGIIFKAEDVALNTIRDNPGAKTQKTRVGRGPGSGKGKTSGRGHGGQKARSGGAKPAPGFEGGQTPLYKKVRKFGFSNALFKRELAPLNLHRLKYLLDAGHIDPKQVITMKTLYDVNAVKKFSHGVKLLGTGADTFNYPINIEVTACSVTAKAAVEAAGGSVKSVYYNRLGLRALLFPEKFDILPRLARPPPKLMKRYPEWVEVIKERNLEIVQRRDMAGLPTKHIKKGRDKPSKEETAKSVSASPQT